MRNDWMAEMERKNHFLDCLRETLMVDRKRNELESMEYRYDIETKEEVIVAAKSLHQQGVEHVIVLLDDGTAVLICKDRVYESGILRKGPAVNTVGTGDSMVAGFLMNYVRTTDPIDSFRFGASCGTATAYSRGLATREKIDHMYESTEIHQIG